MKLNAIDWGNLTGSLVKGVVDYNTAKQQTKAIQAQADVVRAQNEAKYLSLPSVNSISSSFGVSNQTLMLGAAAILLILILKRK